MNEFNEHIVVNPNFNYNPWFTLSMCGITYPDFTYKKERQSAPFYIFEYVISGKGTIIENGKRYSVNAGDTYILKQFGTHKYFSDPSNPMKKIWFNAKGTIISSLLASYNLEQVTVLNNSDTLSFFEEILRISEQDDLSPALRDDYCSIVVHRLIQHMNRKTYSDTLALNSDALRLKNYIEQNFQSSITLDDLSVLINRSPSQVVRIFKSEFHTTPHDYLIFFRIQCAKRFLKETGKSVKDIADSIGFSDEHYFSATFRKKVGMTPLTYRKRKTSLLT